MTEEKLQKRKSLSLTKYRPYAFAFGVVGALLWVVGFPIYVIVFLGFLAYFVSKTFAAGASSDSRKIFEFYLIANEILRDENRRWYGFELHDAIARGETINRAMPSSPPLVHFALGALYRKVGDHASAAKHLALVLEDNAGSEAAIVYPLQEIRDYVKMLRRIEREPAEAPFTSAAVRSLERLRRKHGQGLLAESRMELDRQGPRPAIAGSVEPRTRFGTDTNRHAAGVLRSVVGDDESPEQIPGADRNGDLSDQTGDTGPYGSEPIPERKPITEVLRDIYDKNVH